jgi:Zn-finger nucleic acid-binding protein
MPLVDDFRDHRDRGAAVHLAQHAGAGSNGRLDCPLCGGALNHHAHGGGESGEIMIDSCETCCQIWLDRATLAKLVLTLAPPPRTPAQPEPDLAVSSRRGSPALMQLNLYRRLNSPRGSLIWLG